MKNYRSVLKQEDYEIDVSERKVILFGSGKGCYYLKPQLFSDIEYVVDSNEDKQGRSICFYDREYVISSPDLLSTLNPDEYYIVITALSDEGILSIRKCILNCETDKPFLTAQYVFDYGKSNLSFWYDSMESMLLCDSNMHRRIELYYQPAFQIDYINRFHKALTVVFGDDRVEGVCPVRLGYGLVFVFLMRGGRYLFKVPKVKSRICLIEDEKPDNIYIDRKVISHSLSDYGSEEKIVIYEDDSGCQIQRAGISGDEVIWTDPMIKMVLEKIHSLHNTGKKIPIQSEIIGYVERPRLALSKMGYTPWTDRLKCIEDQASYFYELYKHMTFDSVLSHADLGTYNIVICDDAITFIDWEAISMQDPLYDICKFINTTGIGATDLKNRFREYLTIGLGSSVTDTDYTRACRLLLICAWFELMFEIEKTPQLEHSDCFSYVEELFRLFGREADNE